MEEFCDINNIDIDNIDESQIKYYCENIYSKFRHRSYEGYLSYIEESLKSHTKENVIKGLNKILPDEYNVIELNKSNNEPGIIKIITPILNDLANRFSLRTCILKSSKLSDEVYDLIDFYVYNITYVELDDINKKYIIYLEPTYTKNVTNEVKKNGNIVYHITHKNNLKYILKSGLRPKVGKTPYEDTEKGYILIKDGTFNIKSKNYSKFCTNSCAKSYAGKQIINKFKQAKCIDCGCNIIIKSKSSTKSCRCEYCKFLHKNPIKKCIVCGKEFRKNKAKCCSKECFQYYISNKKKYLSKSTMDRFVEIGRKSAEIQKETRRSKNEIYFFELCKNHFNNISHNERIFNGWDADVIIEDYKIAVLWNGPWHYKQICKNHSVKQVQNRDKIKLNEIKKMGYIPYIIKDDGSENKKFVEEQFNIFLNFIKNIYQKGLALLFRLALNIL